MITLTLPFPPSVNNLFINAGRKRVRSPRYRAWADEAYAMILAQQMVYRQSAKGIAVSGPVTLHYEFQEGQDKRKRDIGNLEKAVTDALVEHKIIEDDNNTIVREITLRWSRKVMGVHITILPHQEQAVAA